MTVEKKQDFVIHHVSKRPWPTTNIDGSWPATQQKDEWIIAYERRSFWGTARPTTRCERLIDLLTELDNA